MVPASLARRAAYPMSRFVAAMTDILFSFQPLIPREIPVIGPLVTPPIGDCCPKAAPRNRFRRPLRFVATRVATQNLL